MLKPLPGIVIGVLLVLVFYGVNIWSASQADYRHEIATAEILLRGDQVSPTEYEEFSKIGCFLNTKSRYFYKRVTEQGLKREEVERLCASVQVRAFVVN
ncbi:MAG: hypothetical protein G01um101424_149 [Parcubacteria group bacterium Gr01-1014_24]|nr:MAG: hypothetical protein G01um101424_149 [Parcubacteria group bacterium Gr01-1014_24]